jgi:F-type H+-transporting ATPase subunit alpha
VNVGISVSRVGSAAQIKAMKKVSGSIKLELAQYREMAAFSQFASDLDEATRKQLERGQRVTELMKQKQYAPMSVAGMAVSLFAADRGYLDDVPLDKVVDFEDALQSYMNANCGELLQKINESGNYDDEIEAAFIKAVEDFKTNHTW